MNNQLPADFERVQMPQTYLGKVIFTYIDRNDNIMLELGFQVYSPAQKPLVSFITS